MALLKTRDLSGIALDWVVQYAQATGEVIRNRPKCLRGRHDSRLQNYDRTRLSAIMEGADITPINCVTAMFIMENHSFAIFERIGFWYAAHNHSAHTRDQDGEEAMIMVYEEDVIQGDTLLEAIKRCYAVTVIGYTVDVPQEYIQSNIK